VSEGVVGIARRRRQLPNVATGRLRSVTGVTSADDAALHPAECATALRDALTDADRVRARNRLARAIRALAMRVLQWCGVPSDGAEDLANALTLDVLARVESGEVIEGRESAYTKQCARHRAADYHRARSGVHERAPLEDDSPCLARDDDAETLMVNREEAMVMKGLVDDVRAVIEQAPPSYRRIIQEVYGRGTPIEELARRDLEARLLAGEPDDKATRKRARDAVDKQLQRARDWVRSRVVKPATARPAPRRGA
jgi:DNA-directed RNA polymerase specialized sigma24 family protein